MKLLMTIFAISLLTSCKVNTPCQGTKVGQIVKVSEEGFLFSTTEIELIRGGFTDGSGVMGRAFHATIADPSVAEEAIKAMELNKEVAVTYKASLISPFWVSESGVFVTSIKYR